MGSGQQWGRINTKITKRGKTPRYVRKRRRTLASSKVRASRFHCPHFRERAQGRQNRTASSSNDSIIGSGVLGSQAEAFPPPSLPAKRIPSRKCQPRRGHAFWRRDRVVYIAAMRRTQGLGRLDCQDSGGHLWASLELMRYRRTVARLRSGPRLQLCVPMCHILCVKMQACVRKWHLRALNWRSTIRFTDNRSRSTPRSRPDQAPC